MASIGPFSFPPNGFEAVIFDCDGTLVDSMPAHFAEGVVIEGDVVIVNTTPERMTVNTGLYRDTCIGF